MVKQLFLRFSWEIHIVFQKHVQTDTLGIDTWLANYRKFEEKRSHIKLLLLSGFLDIFSNVSASILAFHYLPILYSALKHFF